MREATDPEVIAHARETAARHESRREDDAAVADLLDVVETLADALQRHQPVPPDRGWNDAWDRFDRRQPKA
jgi:hypothetical protein